MAIATTSTKGHAPLPWRLQYSEMVDWLPEPYPQAVVDAAGKNVAFSCVAVAMSLHETSLANTAFLVTAANSYHAMREALEEILDYRGGANNALEDEYVMERILAALALAEKGT